MPAPVIPATNPVVVPGTDSVTYDKWFMTQLIIKATPTTAPAIVHLRRSRTDGSTTVLMPQGPGSEISFTVDIFAQLQAFPALETAMGSVLEAIIAYASSKHLI